MFYVGFYEVQIVAFAVPTINLSVTMNNDEKGSVAHSKMFIGKKETIIAK